MEIVKMLITELVPAPYNPRRMKPAVLEKLKQSILKFKVYLPLIVNLLTKHVVGGNQRLLALRELGYKEVSVITVELSLEEEMALNLLLNKLVGEFYDPALPQVYETILKQPDLVPYTGFDLEEMLRSIDLHMSPPADNLNEDLSFNFKDKPVTQIGELVSLGQHKILCDDFIKKDSLDRLFGIEKIAVDHSDLPFGVDLVNKKYKARKTNSKQWQPIVGDDLSGPKYVEWFLAGRKALAPFLDEGAPFYLWSGFRNFGSMSQLLGDVGYHVSNVITWVKPSGCFGFGQYKFASEFLIYGWWGKGKVRCWQGPKNETNVWEVDRADTVSYEHPSAKPVSLACRVIRNSTRRGDIVFDSCAGSGFNLIASEQMGRVFRGCEIEPHYVDVMVRRYARTFGMDKLSSEVRNRYFEGGTNGKA